MSLVPIANIKSTYNKCAPSFDGALGILQVCFVDQDMHIVQLLLGNRGGCIHHQVLCVLVHGEGDDLADALLASQQHDDTVNAGKITF